MRNADLRYGKTRQTSSEMLMKRFGGAECGCVSVSVRECVHMCVQRGVCVPAYVGRAGEAGAGQAERPAGLRHKDKTGKRKI